MYLGGVGPHVLPLLIRHLIDWAFAEVPKYKELIEVDCSRENGRPRFALTFHGLNPTKFRPGHSSAWMKVVADPRTDFLLKLGIAASSHFQLECSNGRKCATLTVTDDSAQITSSRASEARYTRLIVEPLKKLFGRFSHDEFYQLGAALKPFALLHPGLKIRIRDQSLKAEQFYQYLRGLESSLLEEDYQPWASPDVLRFAAAEGAMRVQGCLRVVGLGIPTVRTFVNGTPTYGGTDLEGLGDVLQALFPKRDRYSFMHPVSFVTNPYTGSSIEPSRTFVGAMQLSLPQPRFYGSTKDYLCNPDVREFVRNAAGQITEQWRLNKERQKVVSRKKR